MEVTKAALGVRKPTEMGTVCSYIAVDHTCRRMATWAELGSYRDLVLYPISMSFLTKAFTLIN